MSSLIYDMIAFVVVANIVRRGSCTQSLDLNLQSCCLRLLLYLLRIFLFVLLGIHGFSYEKTLNLKP